MNFRRSFQNLMYLIIFCLTCSTPSLAYNIDSGSKVTLRMLVREGYAPKSTQLAFQQLMQQEYGVEVKFEVDFVGDPEQFLESLRRRSHEVISPAHSLIKSRRWPLISSKLLLPIETNNIPNFKKIIPSLQRADFLTDANKTYAVPFLHGTYALAYNSTLVKEPTSWEVLWAPESKGKYAVSSTYPEVNIYITALAMGISIDKESMDRLDQVITPGFEQRIKQLAGNAARVWQGVDSATMLSGLTYSTSWGFSINDLNSQGEAWKLSSPKEGSPAWIDTWALAAHLKRLPARRWVAEQWINFTLSDQIQTRYMRQLNVTPLNEKVARIASSIEVERFHIGDRKYFDELLLWPALSAQAQDAYQDLWRNAFP